MRTITQLCILCILITVTACQNKPKSDSGDKIYVDFPSEMVEFIPYKKNPVFTGTGGNNWDKEIRERGYILFEDNIYKMWYTGYNSEISDQKFLGYATSLDGINWSKHPGNPVFSEKWTEDMFVIKSENTYYMYAEGENDVAHLLVSADGINWEEKGDLIIRSTKGEPVPGPYGTPTILIEDGKWHLFYERNDEGVWLAMSDDKITWVNVQDELVLKMGPATYDLGAVAANQLVKFKNKFYLYYHATSRPDWQQRPESDNIWTSNVAMSTDLLHWVKYPGNPIIEGDHSSPILVFDSDQPCLFTMHSAVCRYSPK